jgi:hypothetical protein
MKVNTLTNEVCKHMDDVHYLSNGPLKSYESKQLAVRARELLNGSDVQVVQPTPALVLDKNVGSFSWVRQVDESSYQAFLTFLLEAADKKERNYMYRNIVKGAEGAITLLKTVNRNQFFSAFNASRSLTILIKYVENFSHNEWTTLNTWTKKAHKMAQRAAKRSSSTLSPVIVDWEKQVAQKKIVSPVQQVQVEKSLRNDIRDALSGHPFRAVEQKAQKALSLQMALSDVPTTHENAYFLEQVLTSWIPDICIAAHKIKNETPDVRETFCNEFDKQLDIIIAKLVDIQKECTAEAMRLVKNQSEFLATRMVEQRPSTIRLTKSQEQLN